MRSFDYSSFTTVEETLQRLDSACEERVRPLAGGTDLLPLMKQNIVTPVALVDIKRIEPLAKGIEADTKGDGLRLGALTTLSDVACDPLIANRFPLLAEAAGLAATPQLRNMATIGGNLLQRPRCWYYRNELLPCWLKGGDACPAYEGQNEFHALFGNGPCYAVHPSDLAAALLAVDAQVELRSTEGERTVPLADFFALPTAAHRRESVIGEDELLLAVHVPGLFSGEHSTYVKAMDRKVWAFALAGVAATVVMQKDVITDLRLVLSGVAPIPWRVTAAEELLRGKTPSESLFAQAAEVAITDAEPLAHNEYKIPLVKSLLRRALTDVAPT